MCKCRVPDLQRWEPFESDSRRRGDASVPVLLTRRLRGWRVPMGPLLVYGGNIYGTAQDYGTYFGGVVWELTPSGTKTVLYNFQGVTDAYDVRSGVIADSAGNLYGTSAAGGAYGLGTVWKLTKAK